MTLKDEQRTDIMNIKNISDAVTWLQTYQDDIPDPEIHIHKVTYGLNKKFHYKWHEEKDKIEKEKSGYITLKGGQDRIMTYEELWDEIDARIAYAKKILIENLTETEPFEARTK